MAPFPLTYLRWRLRMTRNLIAEKREYVVLATGVGLMSLIGLSTLWTHGARRLASVLQEESTGDTTRVTVILMLSLCLALSFMALANVTTRFFGQQRMDEREQLVGPVAPFSLFFTELLDALKLPVVAVTLGVVAPFSIALGLAGFPPMAIGLTGLDILALSTQPTLLVMALYILSVRLLPEGALRSRVLKFALFVLLSLGGALALSSIQHSFTSGSPAPSTLPPAWIAGTITAFAAGDVHGALVLSRRMLGLTLLLGSAAFLLYRFGFLPRLEMFSSHAPARQKEGTTPGRRGWATRLLFRHLPQEVAGIVLKDLRSSRRDRAQRIALTAMAAVVCALVLIILLSGTVHAVLLEPILAAYALFMVSCQGLSTFSAEGGLMENLAQLPIDARSLLKAKIIGHSILFSATFLAILGMFLVTPSYVDFVLRLLVVILAAPAALALSVLLGWLTVCLGAIFPKPGQGGGHKEISVLAMGLYLELTAAMGVSITASLVAAVTLRGVFIALVPIVVGVWWIAVRFIHAQTLRAVGRALGAEFRSG